LKAGRGNPIVGQDGVPSSTGGRIFGSTFSAQLVPRLRAVAKRDHEGTPKQQTEGKGEQFGSRADSLSNHHGSVAA